eukprot:jgi/Mesvir1/2446/Mv21126-RA.1
MAASRSIMAPRSLLLIVLLGLMLILSHTASRVDGARSLQSSSKKEKTDKDGNAEEGTSRSKSKHEGSSRSKKSKDMAEAEKPPKPPPVSRVKDDSAPASLIHTMADTLTQLFHIGSGNAPHAAHAAPIPQGSAAPQGSVPSQDTQAPVPAPASFAATGTDSPAPARSAADATVGSDSPQPPAADSSETPVPSSDKDEGAGMQDVEIQGASGGRAWRPRKAQKYSEGKRSSKMKQDQPDKDATRTDASSLSPAPDPAPIGKVPDGMAQAVTDSGSEGAAPRSRKRRHGSPRDEARVPGGSAPGGDVWAPLVDRLVAPSALPVAAGPSGVSGDVSGAPGQKAGVPPASTALPAGRGRRAKKKKAAAEAAAAAALAAAAAEAGAAAARAAEAAAARAARFTLSGAQGGQGGPGSPRNAGPWADDAASVPAVADENGEQFTPVAIENDVYGDEADAWPPTRERFATKYRFPLPAEASKGVPAPTEDAPPVASAPLPDVVDNSFSLSGEPVWHEDDDQDEDQESSGLLSADASGDTVAGADALSSGPAPVDQHFVTDDGGQVPGDGGQFAAAEPELQVEDIELSYPGSMAGDTLQGDPPPGYGSNEGGGFPQAEAQPDLTSSTGGFPQAEAQPDLTSSTGGFPQAEAQPDLTSSTGGFPQAEAQPDLTSSTGGFPQAEAQPDLTISMGGFPQAEAQPDLTSSTGGFPLAEAQPDLTSSTGGFPLAEAQPDLTSSTGGFPQAEAQPDLTSSTGGFPQAEAQPDLTSSTGGFPQAEAQPDLTSSTGGFPQAEAQPDLTSSTGGFPQAEAQPDLTSSTGGFPQAEAQPDLTSSTGGFPQAEAQPDLTSSTGGFAQVDAQPDFTGNALGSLPEVSLQPHFSGMVGGFPQGSTSPLQAAGQGNYPVGTLGARETLQGGADVAANAGWKPSACPNGCSGVGTCNSVTRACACPPWLTGDDCGTNALPACMEGTLPAGNMGCAGRMTTCECLRDCDRAGLFYSEERSGMCVELHGSSVLEGVTYESMLSTPLTQYGNLVRYHRSLVAGKPGQIIAQVGRSDHQGAKSLPAQSSCPDSCLNRGDCVENGGSTHCQCSKGYAQHNCFEGPETPSLWDCTRLLNGCSGDGVCDKGFCRCQPGTWGIDCSLEMQMSDTGMKEAVRALVQMPDYDTFTALGDASRSQRVVRPHPGDDGVIGPPVEVPPKPVSPLIYVYELPPRFTSGMNYAYTLKRGLPGEGASQSLELLFHLALLNSQHRTADPEKADFFFVPTWSRQVPQSWQTRMRFHRDIVNSIRLSGPWWDRTNGADHIFVSDEEYGLCGSKKEIAHERLVYAKAMLGNAIWVHHFGLTADKDTLGSHWFGPCHKPGIDITVPTHTPLIARGTNLDYASGAPWTSLSPLLSTGGVARSPAWSPSLEWTQGLPSVTEPRRALLYVSGGTGDIHLAKRNKQLDLVESCFKNKSDVVIQREHDVEDYIARLATSRFCLAPEGGSGGSGLVDAVLMGCVPIVVVGDGMQQPFEELLDYDRFSIRIDESALPQLLDILHAVPAACYTAMQAEGQCVMTRFLWRSTRQLPPASADASTFFGQGGDAAATPGVPPLLPPGPDAFASVMDVLRRRLDGRGKEPLPSGCMLDGDPWQPVRGHHQSCLMPEA